MESEWEVKKKNSKKLEKLLDSLKIKVEEIFAHCYLTGSILFISMFSNGKG